jgi:hypothetical protein
MAVRRVLEQAQGKASREHDPAQPAAAIAPVAYVTSFVRYEPQVPLLQRGAVLGQLESSRQATQRPLAQYGAVDEHDVASTHSAQ